MSKLQKDIKRLQSKPKDFTYDELKKILNNFGFTENTKGKTSGSRVVFENRELNKKMELHRPHPNNILKMYQIKEILSLLKDWRVL